VLTAAAVQAQYRKSLPVVGYAGHSPSSSPGPRKRLMSEPDDRGGGGGGHNVDDETPSSPSSPTGPSSAQRRGRLRSVASMALRKSIDGPRHGEDGEEVNVKNLRSLLVKTAAANVCSLLPSLSLSLCLSLVPGQGAGRRPSPLQEALFALSGS